jgi:HD-like signal output (HDOD) protein
MNMENPIKLKKLDIFLDSNPQALKKIQDLASTFTQLPSRQRLLYNLMSMATDVNTFNTNLIDYLAEDSELSKKIVQKARLSSSISQARISVTDLKQSIIRLGYEQVHKEVQQHLAGYFTKMYFSSSSQHTKTLIKRSVRLGFLARELNKLLGLNMENLMFFAGLNFYIGEIALSMHDPRAMQEILLMQERGVDPKTAQLTVLGFDLAELSAKIVSKWHLPDPILDLVKNSSDLGFVDPDNFKSAILMRFTLFMALAFSNKNLSPKATWDKAYEFMGKLDVKHIDSETWIQEIKLLYIRLLETEHTLFQR